MNARALTIALIAAAVLAMLIARAVSVRGLDKLKREEGLRLKRYRDEKGVWTIGYGHKILPGENLTEITEPEAEAILRKDIALAERAVRKGVKVPITQAQFDALVSFAFNVGVNAFHGSTLLRKLNAGDAAGAAKQFTVWDNICDPTGCKESKVLALRRMREKKMFEGVA